MIYWARPKEGVVCLSASEHHAIKWCGPEDLEALEPAMSEAVKWYCLQSIAEVA